jgi:RimJ/RimL family protein N-acetyltransferase
VSSTTIERVETPRTVLVRMRMDDLPDMLRLLQDPRVAESLWPEIGVPTEQDVISGTAAKERHWERFGFGLWVQRDKETGEMVGRGGLQWTYVGGREEVEVAFGPLHLDEIVAFTLPRNRASRRVMEKTGFRYEKDIVHANLPHVLYRRRRGR